MTPSILSMISIKYLTPNPAVIVIVSISCTVLLMSKYELLEHFFHQFHIRNFLKGLPIRKLPSVRLDLETSELSNQQSIY